MADVIIGFLGLMALCLMAVIGTILFFLAAVVLLYVLFLTIGVIWGSITGMANSKAISA